MIITDERASQLFRDAFKAVTGEELSPNPTERLDHDFEATVQSFNVHVQCPCGQSGWWLVLAFAGHRTLPCRSCGRLLSVSIHPSHVEVKTHQITKKMETPFNG